MPPAGGITNPSRKDPTMRVNYTRVYYSKAEAEADRENRGIPGYSERYPSAAYPVELADGTTGWQVDFEEYRG